MTVEFSIRFYIWILETAEIFEGSYWKSVVKALQFSVANDSAILFSQRIVIVIPNVIAIQFY